MKRVYFEQYGGPEVIKLEDAPIPEVSEGQVLLKMEAAGISKPDFLMRTGAYPWWRRSAQASPPYRWAILFLWIIRCFAAATASTS